MGGSFGSRAVGPTDYWMGREHYFPAPNILLSLVTFGILPRPWEGADRQDARARDLGRWPELGFFDVDHFDPRGWHTMVYNPAFALATARDRYWGAKRVLAVSERELRAAIEAGGYRPETAERLFAVLWGRRQKIVRAYLADQVPLDYFRMEAGRLCFDDLWHDAGLGGDEVRASGGRLDGRCVNLPQSRGYRIVELEVKRAGERHFSQPVKVHLIDNHIVGIER